MQFFKSSRLQQVSYPLTVLLVCCIPMYCASGDSTLEPELIEGDIVLDQTTAFAIVNYKSGTSRRKREAVRGNIRVWNNAVIPYVISENLDNSARAIIRKAFRQFTRRTCIAFIPKQSYHNDYVKFISSNGCYSSVGKKGGEQLISIGRRCKDRGSTIHEIMHTIGFFHEHSRFDRDKYIKILWWNIQKGMERNFISYDHETTDSLNEPYDYRSIMHYNNKAFSRNGRDTMQSNNNPRQRFGKRKALSTVDIRQLSKLYSCSQKKKASCRNRYKRCGRYAKHSDMCESGYNFMKIYCEKACAFC